MTLMSIYVCPAKNEPMVEVRTALVEVETGIIGNFRTNVSLISLTELSRINGLRSIRKVEPYRSVETRRNFVTLGVDLNDLVGKTFQIGTVVFKGTGLCHPCNHPDVLSGKTGFKPDFEGHGGLRAKILSGGTIEVGNSIVLT